MSNDYWDISGLKWVNSGNKGQPNSIQGAHAGGLFRMPNLSLLVFNGGSGEEWSFLNYSFLQGLGQLQTLDLSNNQITDYSFLQGLGQLQTLNLIGNQIIDISSLQRLGQLQTAKF